MPIEIETVPQFNLRRIYNPDFKNGVEVEWQEDGGRQHTCTGTIICEDKGQFGQNPFGHYSIRVDMEPISNYHHACHTASEMHLQTVCRSLDLHNLRLKGTLRTPI